MEESTPQRKSFDKLIHSAITVETDLESNSSSSESEVGEEEEKDLTSIPSYLLSNHCLDSAFSQGTISVRVVKTTLLPPFQPYQINSHLVFGDLSNFAVVFKACSRISPSSIDFPRPDFFPKPIKGTRFSVEVINQSKESIQVLAGTSLGNLFLYPHFKSSW